MKKNQLFLILFLGFSLLISSCKKDETVTPAVSKTDLISRKWGISEEYLDGDGKKVVIYGTGRPANLSLSTDTTPNDYFLFGKDGKLEVYTDSDKKTITGTWKFVSNESQVLLTYDKTNMTLTIDNLTDKASEISLSVLVANAATASQDEKNIILLGAFAGVVTNTTVKVKYGMKFIAK
jgi:hypothetical protein